MRGNTQAEPLTGRPVTDRIVLLSGEHPTLPLAELQALLAVHAPGARVLMLSPTVVRVHHDDPTEVDAALQRMALAHAWAEHWIHTAGGEEGLTLLHEHIRDTADGRGTVAVRAKRSGAERRISGAGLERSIGAALGLAGHKVDLGSPDTTVTAWINGDHVSVGRLIGKPFRSRYQGRRVSDRDHFSPITLHPRRAASLVHLARVPPGGRLYDPFCGTGGILLEAAIDDHDVWGSDLDAWMVQGTYQTLTDAADEVLDATVFRADIGVAPELAEDIDGIVTDMPYGQASTTDGEDLLELYQRSFDAFAAILEPGAYAVFGCAEQALGEMVDMHGFEIEEHHEEYVHRSMTRHYFVARRA